MHTYMHTHIPTADIYTYMHKYMFIHILIKLDDTLLLSVIHIQIYIYTCMHAYIHADINSY